MMRKLRCDVSEDDWKTTYSYCATSPIMPRAIEGQANPLQSRAICLLCRKYRLGDWEGAIPDPRKLPNPSYLGWEDECYCLFHRGHPKFGGNIIECGHS